MPELVFWMEVVHVAVLILLGGAMAAVIIGAYKLIKSILG